MQFIDEVYILCITDDILPRKGIIVSALSGSGVAFALELGTTFGFDKPLVQKEKLKAGLNVKHDYFQPYTWDDDPQWRAYSQGVGSTTNKKGLMVAACEAVGLGAWGFTENSFNCNGMDQDVPSPGLFEISRSHRSQFLYLLVIWSINGTNNIIYCVEMNKD